MITLHRLGHTDEPFQLNPDLIVTIESTPDTVVTLATTAKVVVAETPEQVCHRDARLARGRASPRRCAAAAPEHERRACARFAHALASELKDSRQWPMNEGDEGRYSDRNRGCLRSPGTQLHDGWDESGCLLDTPRRC